MEEICGGGLRPKLGSRAKERERIAREFFIVFSLRQTGFYILKDLLYYLNGYAWIFFTLFK